MKQGFDSPTGYQQKHLILNEVFLFSTIFVFLGWEKSDIIKIIMVKDVIKSEYLSTYSPGNLNDSVPMGRDDFYIEQITKFRKFGKPTRACEVVAIMLFTVNESKLAS